MLVFETPKTGLLKVSLRTHNQMLSTQLPRVQAYTHTHTERGSMDARRGFLQKEASFFGPVAFNVGAARRDIQGNIHSVWTIDMPTFMPPKPTRNGLGTKKPLPTMQKEGTRNTQERFIIVPHRNWRRSWV